jgi:hypothetical protein
MSAEASGCDTQPTMKHELVFGRLGLGVVEQGLDDVDADVGNIRALVQCRGEAAAAASQVDHPHAIH